MYCPQCRAEYPDRWKRCPTDETPLLRGPTLGKYRIDKLIGTGGMGSVYRAINPDTESAVAIKVLHGSSAGLDAARARFQREAAAVAALTTRHVVSIFDFGDDDDTLYLVMELLLGHTLRREIATPPEYMPLARLNLAFDGALRGLGAAHRAGIVHRDLKPENVFIAETDDGEVAKLLDFGIARKSGGATLTHSGALMGTPAYMAPEQVAGNRGEVGPWSDVYAMGVILYEMLSGRAPFAADSMTEVLAKVLSREFPPLRSVRDHLPEAVYLLCERALADAPGDRFPHADALREAWADAFTSFPAELRSATVPRFQPPAGTGDDLASAPTAAPAVPTPTTAEARRASGDAVTASPFAATQATPSPVVVSTGEEARAPRRGRLVAVAVGGVVVAGAAAAVVMLSSNGARTTPLDAAPVHPVEHDLDAAPLAIDAGAPPGMAYLPGGTFTMGTAGATAFPNALAEQATEVEAFYLDRLEMTALAARSALGQSPHPGDAPDMPARSLTWADADAACRALGKRLPTEAEWEYAAQRSPLDAAGARLKTGTTGSPAPVGSHRGDCTSDGVCDLLGNVMEWTADGTPAARIARGASFNVSATEAGWFATVRARTPAPPDRPDPEIGFRCAADAGAGRREP